jgi:anti-sigma factor RsiW
MTRIECADVKDLLPELIRGELEDGDLAVVTTHVSSCESCSEEVEFLERIRGAAFSPPASLASEIKSAVASEMESDAGFKYRTTRFVRWGLPAAATVVLALGTGVLWQRAQTLPVVGPLGQDPFAAVWPSDDADLAGVPIVAGVPMLSELTDEELVLLLEELGG